MLHYTRQGTGAPLVLIHGFLGSTAIFDRVIGPLSQSFDVIAVDLPGHGESVMEKEAYTVYDYAQEIVNVLKEEGIEEATWVGHSLGGYITLAALEKQLIPITKAVLAYSSPAADSELTKSKRNDQQAIITKQGVEHYVDYTITKFFKKDAKPTDVEFAKKIANGATKEGLVAALEAMKQRPNQQQLLDTTETPILVIEGKEDTIVEPVETDNLYVEMMLTNTGHLGMLEEPRGFVNLIADFEEQYADTDVEAESDVEAE
ncbi:alpha/beta fold hydrolase [Kurthia sp. Dielmo]|uniref:alpha/beta fold hydrolase n=1 Tax=Kurthia sp. Dielmo TaxID=1033738 RepID=UPI000302E478|nr:alpha/beta hydrolase [Kurthia sp. Dielmo]